VTVRSLANSTKIGCTQHHRIIHYNTTSPQTAAVDLNFCFASVFINLHRPIKSSPDLWSKLKS